MANNTDELKHNQELNSKTSGRTPPIPYGSLAHPIFNKPFTRQIGSYPVWMRLTKKSAMILFHYWLI
jgi:hypothetical protein